jgi:MFS family permease
VFAVPAFRVLWLAQVLSVVGDQLAQVALSVLAFHRTGSPLLTGVVYALSYLPGVAGGPLLAGLADRLPRRRLMVGCDRRGWRWSPGWPYRPGRSGRSARCSSQPSC